MIYRTQTVLKKLKEKKMVDFKKMSFEEGVTAICSIICCILAFFLMLTAFRFISNQDFWARIGIGIITIFLFGSELINIRKKQRREIDDKMDPRRRAVLPSMRNTSSGRR